LDLALRQQSFSRCHCLSRQSVRLTIYSIKEFAKISRTIEVISGEYFKELKTEVYSLS
jgi:hypothetical protein